MINKLKFKIYLLIYFEFLMDNLHGFQTIFNCLIVPHFLFFQYVYKNLYQKIYFHIFRNCCIFNLLNLSFKIILIV